MIILEAGLNTEPYITLFALIPNIFLINFRSASQFACLLLLVSPCLKLRLELIVTFLVCLMVCKSFSTLDVVVDITTMEISQVKESGISVV